MDLDIVETSESSWSWLLTPLMVGGAAIVGIGLLGLLTPDPHVHEIADAEEHSALFVEGGPTAVIHYGGDKFGPSRDIKPDFMYLSVMYPTIHFFSVDLTKIRNLGISSVPTFCFLKNGEKVETVVGAERNKLRATLEKLQ